MKKKNIWLLCSLCIAVGLAVTTWIFWPKIKPERPVTIDEQNFPDEIFRTYVSETYDKDHDGILSPDECQAVKECLVSRKEIQNLRGIEHFPNLEKLDCSFNPIRKLNVSKNTRLKSLNVRGGDVTKENFVDYRNGSLVMLNVTGCKALLELDCACNSLLNLDLSGCPNLGYLDCSFNPLMSLDLSGKKKLKYLDVCGGKKLNIGGVYPVRGDLRKLDLDDCTALERLDLSFQMISEMDVSRFPNLVELRCKYTLEDVDVSSNAKLESLSCGGTPFIDFDTLTINSSSVLKELDVSDSYYVPDLSMFPNLEALDVSFTGIDHLDLSYTPNLLSLKCCDNNLTELDLSVTPKLTSLDYSKNDLKDFDVSICTALEELVCQYTNRKELDLSHNPALVTLDCWGNEIRSLDLSHNPMLKKLVCSSNEIERLDLSSNELLEYVCCSYNEMVELNLSGCKNLDYLDCLRNPLKELQLEGIPLRDHLYVDEGVALIGVGEYVSVTRYR